MRREFLTVAVCAPLLASCALNDGPPSVASIVSEPQEVAANASSDELRNQVRAPENLSDVYDTSWICRWGDVPATWDLPQLRITDGRVMVLNDWTRLKGEFPEIAATETASLEETPQAAPESATLKLVGERRSEDGEWYRMILYGPIYPERASVLKGYWKGATCRVRLTPMV